MAITDSPLSKDEGAADSMGSQFEARIPMADGVELSATLYVPATDLGPQPCIIEALPYRKDDLTSSYSPDYIRLRDEFDYAVCRVDVRGTGSSGGDATDEYPEAEQRDLAEVMTWLAAQPWCDGNIGMYGTSYSGFNSLQMACERPPELKAIIAIFATDDRYTDDVHYRGGTLKFVDLVDYNHYMTPMNALPPVPALWGDGWRDEWRRRIETNEPWLLTWTREQRDGAYWRHGSVRPAYDRIQCPTLIIAGWADGYRNNSFRIVERLREQGVPHRLLAGPWAHAALESSLPGPRIDSMPELVSWWDRWLRGKDNGIDTGLDDSAGGVSPAGTIFIRSSTRAEPDLDSSAGEWIREEWPCPRVRPEVLSVTAKTPYVVNPAVGTDAWIDCAGLLPWGQSLDQRLDDAMSLTWDFDAGERTLLGQPVARLRLSVDKPVAYLSVKLCDVFPDGGSALVSRGSVNLTHRDGHADPQPMVPGQEYDIEIALDACAYRFDAGQRLRIAVAGSDWPNTAAPPQPVTLTIHGGDLVLPRWNGPSPYEPPKFAPAPEPDSSDPAEGITWAVERDVLRRIKRCVVDHGTSYEAPYAGRVTEHYGGTVSVNERTFAQTAHAETSFSITWAGATVTCRAVMDLVADDTVYDITIDLEALEGEEIVGRRSWRERIPRDLA
jgi:predicted acyl esterase